MPEVDVTVESIVSDSRKVHHGALFAALPGSQVDGHDYAESAARMGAAALLVNRQIESRNTPAGRDRCVGRTGYTGAPGCATGSIRWSIGITGSNGKTSVKEMLASILRLDDEVLATRGNYNNELGLPLSLFELEEKHRYAVLEMGASKAGDIAYLAGIARPDVGLVTNIGPAHLEGFGTEEGVARAKGELFSALPSEGWAIINADEPWSKLWLESNTAEHVLTFGKAREHDIHLDCRNGKSSIVTPEGSFEVNLALPGQHNLINATAATAVALALQIPLEVIRQGLENTQSVPGRLNMLNSAAGWTVIDDTYNANPASLYSALQVLATMQGKSWLVLGDMKELGENSQKMHVEVGDAARAMGVSRMFATGEMSVYTVDAFGEGADSLSGPRIPGRGLMCGICGPASTAWSKAPDPWRWKRSSRLLQVIRQ